MTRQAMTYTSRSSSQFPNKPAPAAPTFDSAQDAFRSSPSEKTAKAYAALARTYHKDAMIGDTTFFAARKEIQAYLANTQTAQKTRTSFAMRDAQAQRTEQPKVHKGPVVTMLRLQGSSKPVYAKVETPTAGKPQRSGFKKAYPNRG